MSTLATLAAVVGEIGVLIGVITPVIVSMRKISNGTKCQLRSEMQPRERCHSSIRVRKFCDALRGLQSLER